MEKTQLIEFLGAIGAGSAITAYITGLLNRKKTSSETNKFDAETAQLRAQLEISINQSALELVNSLRTEVRNLREDNMTLMTEVRKYREENATLMGEIEKLKGKVGICQHQLGLDDRK
jgi:FtsZ-binding cell division protein ZapB